MKTTRISALTKVLAMMLCVVMLAGVMSSCFNDSTLGNTGNEQVGNNDVKPDDGKEDVKPDDGKEDVKPDDGKEDVNPDDGNEDVNPDDGNEDVNPDDGKEEENGFSASTELEGGSLIYGALANDVTIGDSAGVNALVPADVKIADGTSSLALSVKPVEGDAGIALGEGESVQGIDVHISGVAADNKVPMIVNLGAVVAAGISNTGLKLYHIENGTPILMTKVDNAADFSIHNQYTYNAETGEISIYVASFSVIAAVQTSVDEWDGTSDTTWYNDNDTDTEFTLTTAEQFAGFRDLVDGGNTFAGKTIKLGTDIDLANKLFDPIGYGYANSGGKAFMGTFDGAGHTVYNLYQNGWELDPDKVNYSTYTYSTAGAGLFASIKNATIKNLAVSGAEIVFECVDMGIIVGYAQGTCHFENIIVTDSKIANYNRYTGGVVGEVSYGSYGIDTSLGYSHTFKNVTVDSSVTVSGLWGSFGCGMGGVIGGKWGDATVKMENVVSAPTMDVYNDVVSAYQWYAFRGCGMLIGHTEEPYSDGRHSGNATASFLTCENVTVYYGDWVNYTYYEFANQDSATGRNYPWVRAEEGNYCDAFSNIRYGVPTHTVEGVTTAVSELSPEELEKVATGHVVITFDQLYGADRGMYGTNEHDGVTIYSKYTKRIYIHNDLGWENLKLQYWFRNGEDIWTTLIDGVDMCAMYLSAFNVYKIDLPAYADGFKIVADGENEVEYILADLTDGATYTLGGNTHEHEFDVNNKCECGAYKIQKGELVTNIDDLNVGDRIIIVAENSNVALGTTQNTNNRNQVAIVKNNDGTITINNNVQIITLELGNIDETFAFNVGSSYLYAASSSNNYLKTESILSDNSSWLITIDANGVATIKAQGANGNNLLRYNNTSSIFSCYGSGQQDVVIYKLSANEEIVEVHDCKEFAFGATCVDNAICSVCSNEITDSALGHDYVGVEKAPTCTDAGYITYTCSRCDGSYKTDGEEAIGHNYVDGICSVCGAIDSSSIDFTGRYYIAAIRTSGNYFYMTNDLGTASTKRYQAVDSGITTLPSQIPDGEKGYVFVLEKNEDGTYFIYTEGVEGENYLGWNKDNSGILVAKENALKLTVDKKEDGTYNIHFTGDLERYLALNQNSSSDYFAWYKSGQKQDLSLIPVKPCDHNYESVVTAPTCTENGYTTYTCTECGHSYTDNSVDATGHVNTTTTTVDATCTTTGSVTVTCNDCDAVISTETIPTINHNDVNTDNDHDCDACGAENVTNHNYVDGTCDCGATEPAEPTPDPDPETPTEPTWTLVTDVSDLKVGDQIIIVAKDYNFAISTTQNNNNRAQASVEKNGSTIKIGNDVQILTLEAGTVSGTLAFNTGSGYLYAASSSSNHLKTQTTNNANGSWKITISADGTATIVAQGTNSRNTMQYNQSSSLFACYASATQKAIVIYKLEGGNEGGETPSCEHTNTTETTTATCTDGGVTTITCDDCSTTISTEEIAALGHTTENGTCERCKAEIGGTSSPLEDATLSFANKAQRTEFSTTNQVWQQNGITFTNNKASSTNNVADYANPVRLYANSKITITALGNITKIVFDCNSGSYATALKNSIGTVSGATVTVSSDMVTVEFSNAVDSFTIEKLTAQVRMDSITVTYTK